MKLLFVHETKFKEDDHGNFYTGGSYNKEVWQRYLSIADKFTVIARKESKIYDYDTAKRDFNTFNNTNMQFIEIPNLTDSIKEYINIKLRRKKSKAIKEAVKKSDGLIVRLPSQAGFSAVKFANRFNKPYLVELVGCPWDSLWNFGNIKGRILAPFTYITTKIKVRNAPWVIYVSRRFLQKRYPTKGRNIGCPDVVLDEPMDYILNYRLQKIEKLKESNKITLGLIGSLDVAYRGHETAIKVLSSLNDKRFEIKFLGAGDKSRWIQLASQYEVEDRVEFSGQLPSGQPVLEWIDNIDILIMPTQQETLGRAIIEAMSRGCPVIGSIETAISEQIGSDCVCPASDYQTITEIIIRMTEDLDYMKFSAQENFYRSFKYTNKQTNSVRNKFLNEFKNSIQL